MQGKIIKGIAGFYYIYAENDEIYECKAKGIFRKDKQKPLVGDNVEIEVLDEQEKEGSVTAILPRKNSLIRPAVANVDQAFVIFAMESPKPNFMLLDRFLIMMEKENVPAVICFNKKDLAKQEELELLYETYKSCGYDVIFSSTFNGEGLDKVRADLRIVSDKLSDTLATTTIDTAQKVGEGKVQVALAKAELRDATVAQREKSAEMLRMKKAELQAQFDELSSSITNHTVFGQGRIIKAFPEMKHRDYFELIQELKKKLR